jgi:hypothetical protein
LNLRNWDRQLNKKKKKIALVPDNCPAHPKLNLESIELTFLPPSTTSHIHPLDQDIIKPFKTFYRSDIRQRIIQSIDNGLGTSSDIARRVSVLDALHKMMNLWDKVSATCINNCFKKLSSMCCDSVKKDHDTEHVEKPDDACEQEFYDWVDIDCDLQDSTVLTDEEIARRIINQSKEEEGEEESKDEPERIPVSKRQLTKLLAF